MTRTTRLAPLAAAVLTAALAVPLSGPLASPAAAVAPTCASANLTVTALHGPVFYADLGYTPSLAGAYAGYRITDTSGNPRSDVWVELSTFTGGVVALGGGQASAQQIPTLAGNASASRYFYLTANAENVATAQNHTVSLYSGRPSLGGTLLCSTSGGFTQVKNAQFASANKVTGVTVSGSGAAPKIGAQFTVAVEGDTGQIGAGTAADPGTFWMSPSALGTWPADAFRLVGTALTFDGVSQGSDVLRVANLTGNSYHYVATYTFRAIGFTAGATQVVPVQQIASGTVIKHTNLADTSSLPSIPTPINDVTLGSSASVSGLPIGGGQSTITVHVSGSAGAVLDDFAITLPAGASIVHNSVTWAGGAVADPVASSGKLIAQGPFTLPGGGADLVYTVAFAATPGDRTVSTVGRLGTTELDSTADTHDQAPATSTVHVAANPVAAADEPTLPPDQSADIDVLANDTDADGDTVALDSVGVPGHGTATIVGGKVRYTPDEGWTGTDTFTYTVTDGDGGTATGTVTVHVTASTASPTPTTSSPDPTTSTPEPTTSTPDPTTSTPDPTTSTPDPTTSSPDPTTSTPDPTTSSPEPTSTPVADPSDDTAEVAYDGSVLIDVLANDPDGAAITDVTDPAHGTATIENDKIRYAPDGDWAGGDTFTYTVDVDGTPAANAATVSVTVTAADLDVNDDDVTAVAAATPLAVDVLANDSGEQLAVTAVTAAGHGTATLDDGVVTYTSTAGHKGTDTFGYTATDALGRTATGQVLVHVPNAAPTMSQPAPVSVVAGTSATVTVTVADANSDALTVTGGAPSGAASDGVTTSVSGTGATRTVRVTASQAATGTATVPLTVTDGTASAARSLTVTVTPAAPVGIVAGVLPDAAAVKAISKPVYSGGKPVARTLSTRIDSRVTWRRSPTAGVTTYRVAVNGTVVCTAQAQVAATQSCTLIGRALQRTDAVRVTAVAGALTSTAAVVPVVAGTPEQRRLMAVVYFPVGDFKLDATATRVLATVAAQARQYGLSGLTLVGHTDSDGSVAANLTLSRQRAGQVRDWMHARYSWVAGSATGRGELEPAVSNGTSQGKAANRRVEIYVG